MKTNIPWELIIKELKQEISDEDRSALAQWKADEKN